MRGRLVREARPAPLHSRVQSRLIYLVEAHNLKQRTRGAVLVEVRTVERVKLTDWDVPVGFGWAV